METYTQWQQIDFAVARHRRAAIAVIRTFNPPPDNCQRPKHWNALHALENAAQGTECGAVDAKLLTLATTRIHTTFGAPGDFGYGTPEGDALAELYDACNAAEMLSGRECNPWLNDATSR